MNKNFLKLLIFTALPVVALSCSSNSNRDSHSDSINFNIEKEEQQYEMVSARRALDSAIRPYKRMCPMEVAQGMTLVSVERDDNYLVYTIEVSSGINLDNLKLDQEAKEEVKTLVGDNANLVLKAQMGLRYIYVNSAKQERSFIITPAELQEIYKN